MNINIFFLTLLIFNLKYCRKTLVIKINIFIYASVYLMLTFKMFRSLVFTMISKTIPKAFIYNTSNNLTYYWSMLLWWFYTLYRVKNFRFSSHNRITANIIITNTSCNCSSQFVFLIFGSLLIRWCARVVKPTLSIIINSHHVRRG